MYGVLGQKFGREFMLDVANTREAMRALSIQIPGFEQFMLKAHEQGFAFAVFLKVKILAINAERKEQQFMTTKPSV